MVEDDVDLLRRSGWSDDAIVAATHVVGIFNYLVRLADAFGIEWEPEVEASATHQPELWKDWARHQIPVNPPSVLTAGLHRAR